MQSDRKRSRSSITEGQYTRSKSQIYLHCNRSGRVRPDSVRVKPYAHRLQQLHSPVRKSKRPFSQNVPADSSVPFGPDSTQSDIQKVPEGCLDHCEMNMETRVLDDPTRLDAPVKKLKRLFVQKVPEGSKDIRVRVDLTRLKESDHQVKEVDLEGSVDVGEMTRIKDLRAHRVFSPASIVLEENDVNLKNNESNGVGIEINGKKVDEFGVKNGNIGSESDGNGSGNGQDLIELNRKDVPIPKMNSAVSLSLRKKVFAAPSSFSYRRLLPYLMDTVKERSDVSETVVRDTATKSNDPTLSYPKPEMLPVASNGSASEKILPDNLTKTQLDSQVLTNGGGVDPEALEECVQTTPPDADIFCKADMSNLRASIESDRGNGCITKKSCLSPGKNSSVLRNKLVLNPCSRRKVFKASSSLSYRRLLPLLMDVAKSDSGDAASDNGHPNSQRDLECSQPLMPVSKEVPMDKEYSPKKEEIKGQETNLLETKSTSANDVTYCLNTGLSMEVLSSAPDDVANSQNVEVERKSETECTDTSSTDKSEPEGPISEIISFSCETGEVNVGPPSLVPISLEVEVPKVEPISPERNQMMLGVGLQEENMNAIKLIGSSCDEPLGTEDIQADGNNVVKELLHITLEPEPVNNECLKPAETEVSCALVTSPDILVKGILKKNPRGCRGLCNCLNCASFRLHAERAFEFSKNQMQDSEEVTLGLMKELGNLRNFLEKHLSSEDNLPPIPLTPVEVKEACSKALEAEQLAKERLSQMNNELHYHCRVPTVYRPTVTFASHIEEKGVPLIESSSSKSETETRAKTKRNQKKHK